MILKPFQPAAVTPLSLSDIIIALEKMNDKSIVQFEEQVVKYVGAREGIGFPSFMRAIYSCLNVIKQHSAKKTVVIPRYSCPSFAHAILAAGLRIAYCDIDPLTLNITKKSLDTIPKDDILALISVNFFGLSNDMETLSEFCKENDIILIEDLGYSFGTRYKNKKLGSFGDFSVFNFQEGKALPIGGGMITSNTKGLIDEIPIQRRKKDLPRVINSILYNFLSHPLNYSVLYRISNFLDFNIRKRFSMEDTIRKTSKEFDFDPQHMDAAEGMSRFQGALGCQLLKRFDRDLQIRQKNGYEYQHLLEGSEQIQLINPLSDLDRIHYIRYPILIKNNERSKIHRNIIKKGYESSTMYDEHGINIDKKKYPGSYETAKNLLTLPCHPKMKKNDIETVVDCITSF